MNSGMFCILQQGNCHTKKCDISSDIIARSPNSASASDDCLAGVVSNGTYGFVHRNGTNILPQRSLESPTSSRMCDILVDLERSSRSCRDDMIPDLMTKSYHDRYNDVPWLDHRLRMVHVSETDWRRDAVLAAQVTHVISYIAFSSLHYCCKVQSCYKNFFCPSVKRLRYTPST